MKLLFDDNLSPSCPICWRLFFPTGPTSANVACSAFPMRTCGNMHAPKGSQSCRRTRNFSSGSCLSSLHPRLFGCAPATAPVSSSFSPSLITSRTSALSTRTQLRLFSYSHSNDAPNQSVPTNRNHVPRFRMLLVDRALDSLPEFAVGDAR